jgi:quinol monooxygenase YgiN
MIKLVRLNRLIINTFILVLSKINGFRLIKNLKEVSVMSVCVLVEGTLKDEFTEVFPVICGDGFKVTRKVDGCQNINLVINSENLNNFVFTEVWDSKEHYDKYFAFRLEDGTIGAIQNMCSDGPEVRVFNITDA